MKMIMISFTIYRKIKRLRFMTELKNLFNEIE